MTPPKGLVETRDRARASLLERRAPDGSWTGRLSDSALATACAVAALDAAGAEPDRERAARGRAWLRAHQNADGGWGDTPANHSNVSATLIAWAALGHRASTDDPAVARAASHLRCAFGSLDPEAIARALETRYGNDRTFAVPILSLLTQRGALDDHREPWRLVEQLPFEISAIPRPLFPHLRVPVVSYALPALVAIGLSRHRNHPSSFPVARLLRNSLAPRALRVLETTQPSHGGFLEATPLTAFVTINLVAAGLGDCAVVRRSLDFLRASQRADGAWPIDTNLATWLTTLAVRTLRPQTATGPGRANAPDDPDDIAGLLPWLLDQQTARRHPYTDAAPGAWAWTPLEGGVPDADDTAGALLALARLRAPHEPALRGIAWLRHMQNPDGGIPTFCRGWGRFPFDRSAPDISAHALQAIIEWMPRLPARDRPPLERLASGILRYLAQAQNEDGTWVPLWFGNENAPREENRAYGTARVLLALLEIRDPPPRAPIDRALQALVAMQHDDGGWGGDTDVTPSIEETALATHALAVAVARGAQGPPDLPERLSRGARWLISHTDAGRAFPAAPIGLYFARLWYHEELYPHIFTLAAIDHALRVLP